MIAQHSLPFTIHRNTLFEKFICKLKDSGVISLNEIDSAKKIEINKVEVFHEIFSIVFLQYSTPDISNISLCKETK